MKKVVILSVMLSLPLFLGLSSPALAEDAHKHEHGDHAEHGMHDMKGMEGMNEMEKMHAEHAATLREAAAALKDSHPDLAAKLESMVTMHEEKHEGMES